MEAMRETWTDERLDDLTHRVDEGFNRMDREFQAVRLEMRTEFAAVRGEMRVESAAIRAEIGLSRSDLTGQVEVTRSDLTGQIEVTRSDLSGQIAALNRTMLQVGAGAIATIFIGFVAVVATLATQL